MSKQTTEVRSYAEALAAVDGQTVKLDGIRGVIRVDVSGGYTRVWHEPDAAGKRTEAYRKVRAELRDDWSTDLSWSERLVDVMTDCGIVFVPRS